ncbi:MAG: RNA methyltransferase [Spirochaetales bacterium]|nr:RNA methyltransferase [Spirochaetales bacterium]
MSGPKLPDRTPEQLEAIIEKLKTHLTQERWEKIQKVADERTRYISVVMENVYYTQNMSAVVRTCDSLGVQDLHIVGQKNSARINKNVAKGSSNWTTIHRDTRRPVEESLGAIKESGYRLVATLPREDARPLDELDLTKGKIALIFGQEICGLSETAAEMADEAVTIPMYGFAESFNISVSAGICLYELKKKLLTSDIDWHLTSEEQRELHYRWIRKTLKHIDEMEKEYEYQLEHPNDQ